MSPNARKKIIGGASAIILGVFGVLVWRRIPGPTQQPAHAGGHTETFQPALQPPGPPRTEPSRKELIGERILGRYGDPGRSSEEDLTDMAHALGNFALLVKGDNPLPLGANEEIANALRGKNRTHLRFLEDGNRVFNAQGQIVDRWSTPLFFHARSSDRLEIRSAGPDKVMWTADDIHRTSEGRFLRRDDLLPPSLFDSARKTDRHVR